jgi:ferredoxin
LSVSYVRGAAARPKVLFVVCPPGHQKKRLAASLQTPLAAAAKNERHLERKVEIEQQALASFQKSIDVQGLPELLMQTFDHPIYKEVADERCLGCTNCTMVCPTCYCYNVMDRSDFGPKRVERGWQWDSCQDYGFAEVHTGDFRELPAGASPPTPTPPGASRGARPPERMTPRRTGGRQKHNTTTSLGRNSSAS